MSGRFKANKNKNINNPHQCLGCGIRVHYENPDHTEHHTETFYSEGAIPFDDDMDPFDIEDDLS